MKNEFAISEEKLSFKFRWWRWDNVELLFRNSSLLLAFLLWVEGLILFLSTVDFTLIPLVSEVKEKGVLVSLKLKALPWLANVWQKARHWDTKEESISAVIFTCSSQLRKLQKDQRSCHQNPDDYNNIFDASCLAKDLGHNIELKRFFFNIYNHRLFSWGKP